MAPAYVIRGRFWAGPGTVNGWGTNLPMEGASPRFNSRGGIPHRDHGPAPLSPCLAHAVLSILLRGPFRLTRNVHAPQTSLDGTPGGPRRRRPKPRPVPALGGPAAGPTPPSRPAPPPREGRTGRPREVPGTGSGRRWALRKGPTRPGDGGVRGGHGRPSPSGRSLRSGGRRLPSRE